MPRAARAKVTKTAVKENEKTKKKGKDQHVLYVVDQKLRVFFCNRQKDFDVIDFLEHIFEKTQLQLKEFFG